MLANLALRGAIAPPFGQNKDYSWHWMIACKKRKKEKNKKNI